MKPSEVYLLFEEFSSSVERPLSSISNFLEKKIKPQYYDKKEKEFKERGYSVRDAHNKARQSWVSFVGRILEKLIEKSLKDFCIKKDLHITTDRVLRKRNLTKELDLVKRVIEVHFGKYSLLPDADIIIYKYNRKTEQVKIIAILSVKNSFRERYTETPYWKLKLKDNPVTKNIKVFMITPDNDNEISFLNRASRGPRKARIVMESDLDGIYLAKEKYDSSVRVKGIQNLEADLLKLVED